ncbi:zinc-binding dehydrogenase [Bordetella genomosp. 12]|uniref:Alcohol dehydrogenase n=1 Tax=Bordetella genomosp. 12 TaxID=463035 RepID=A0A261VCG7_9BORD|nr:alcohol dehydrogenase catalytic domain-containing protein [Bordetella genomosp. 12]OZI71461.1 alcohol dehydrogenase [Bordetella genomosp. 12]
MPATYRAMQITRPGILEMVQRPVPEPGAAEVLIAVEACGICGADASDIEGADPARQPARVPGHEVVGCLVKLGDKVPTRWTLGQRVGIGRLGGHCNECDPCRQGRFALCLNQHFVGATCDGGYAEMMIARHTGLVSIPDALQAEDAAPILCAGLATFNALKRSGAQAGDLVAVLGIGGLGHMALQYARAMGFKVVALGRGQDIAQDALTLGAHVYIDTHQEDAAAALLRLGGAAALITTVADMAAISAALPGLAAGGRLVLLGAGKDPLPVSPGFLVCGERSLMGSLTGSPYDNERALDFSVLTGTRPLIDTLPLEAANEAYQRMRSGKVTFRMVLTMGANREASSSQ